MLSSDLQIACSIVCVEVYNLRIVASVADASTSGPDAIFVSCKHRELRGEFVEGVFVSKRSWSM